MNYCFLFHVELYVLLGRKFCLLLVIQQSCSVSFIEGGYEELYVKLAGPSVFMLLP